MKEAHRADAKSVSLRSAGARSEVVARRPTLVERGAEARPGARLLLEAALAGVGRALADGRAVAQLDAVDLEDPQAVLALGDAVDVTDVGAVEIHADQLPVDALGRRHDHGLAGGAAVLLDLAHRGVRVALRDLHAGTGLLGRDRARVAVLVEARVLELLLHALTSLGDALARGVGVAVVAGLGRVGAGTVVLAGVDGAQQAVAAGLARILAGHLADPVAVDVGHLAIVERLGVALPRLEVAERLLARVAGLARELEARRRDVSVVALSLPTDHQARVLRLLVAVVAAVLDVEGLAGQVVAEVEGARVAIVEALAALLLQDAALGRAADEGLVAGEDGAQVGLVLADVVVARRDHVLATGGAVAVLQALDALSLSAEQAVVAVVGRDARVRRPGVGAGRSVRILDDDVDAGGRVCVILPGNGVARGGKGQGGGQGQGGHTDDRHRLFSSAPSRRARLGSRSRVSISILDSSPPR